MKSLTILTGMLFVLGCFSIPAAAAEQEQIIIDDLSPAELREQIEIVQKEVYRVFNANNDDESFDIICHRYIPTGSNISQEACEPQFVIDARSENAGQWQFGNDVLLSQDELLGKLQPEFEELTNKMNAIAIESDYFRELNQVLSMLNDRLREITY